VASGQQVADTDFAPDVSAPAFATGSGPGVAIEVGHFNFHTADGRYAPFASLLRRDGFVVRGTGRQFSAATLAGVDVLVVANALNEANAERWSLPTPSAFAREEVEAVEEWVAGGGALLLIADHMPFGGAAAELAGAFGFSFTNGYAIRPSGGALAFNRSDGSLKDHPIVRGRGAADAVESVMTFTGQAFSANGGQALLVLPDDVFLLQPAAAGEFSSATPRAPAGGLLQAATVVVGAGRVAAFGEAAMFSAQLAGPSRQPMGMNAAGAEQNAQFVLNTVRWLAGVLPH
jgi:hypothetical protein